MILSVLSPFFSGENHVASQKRHRIGGMNHERMEGKQGTKEQKLEGWHAVGYIPCLATISIGQDRKYTIKGSSATD